jgi:hypothetical protein
MSEIDSASHLAESQLSRLLRVRAATERLCRPLAIEDYGVQSMPDASPAKWHLAHTSWFFESFVLGPYRPGFQPYCAAWMPLFNSYYVGRAPGIRAPSGDS